MSFRDSDASRPSSRSSRSKPTFQRSSTTPYSSRTTSEHDSGFSESKRNRVSSVLALEELLKPVITIKVGPTGRGTTLLSIFLWSLTCQQPQFAIGPSSDKPFILKPLMLLSRECLPLSTLDLSSPCGEYPTGPGRFFESHIRILDLDGRLRQAPSVLLARSDATRNVYAIERHQLGLYVVCKLGSWISIENLSKLAEASYVSRCIATGQKSQSTEAAAPVTTYQAHKESKRKRQVIEEFQQSMVKAKRQKSVAPEPQPASNQPPVPQMSGQNVHSKPSIIFQGSQTVSADPAADVQTSAEDIFQNIRSHYFEALYHSKGSLAYFAKGTLSKARAAFHFDCDANLEMKDLLAFLKSIVVIVPQIDKKFKETIPKLVDEMKLMLVSSEDGRKPKRKRPRKMKLGKDVMWTGEVEQVQKWWAANKPELREDDDAPINPEEIKYHISCLRTRETQLQMIIILEILALEATVVIHDAQDSLLPGLPHESQPTETVAVASKRKSKQQDYPALVNTHADRLSIWQSTMLEDMRMIAAEAEAKSDQQPPKSGRTDSDPSKDFCIDIIVPFFAGRVPELCAELNRKLGGPVAASSPEPEELDDSTKAPARPGAATKRPTAPRAPKSLSKSLEDDSQKWKASRARPSDALARMRSATPAAIPGIKREASEPVGLDRIPRKDKSLKERSRNVLSRSASSTSNAERKEQKKAEEAKHLQEAILAARKPNRSLVGRAIIEDAEKRTALSNSPRPKKQRKPIRNAAAAAVNRVQVKATPANHRFRDAINGESHRHGNFHVPPPRPEFDVIPSSSSVVPNTAPRKQVVFRDELRDGLAAFHIASTPVAASQRGGNVVAQATGPSSPPNDHCIPESSPIMARWKAPPVSRRGDYMLTIPEADDLAPSSPVLPRVFETPVKRRSTTAVLPSTFEDDENIGSTPPEPTAKPLVYDTPAKKDPTSALVAAPLEPEPVVSSYNNTGGDLYQQMGWEDDFDALF